MKFVNLHGKLKITKHWSETVPEELGMSEKEWSDWCNIQMERECTDLNNMIKSQYGKSLDEMFKRIVKK